jgi:anaerobic magnesium-protoporphyrin IX monomethyl ester cyclase
VRSLNDGSADFMIPGLTYKKNGKPVSCPDRPFEDINHFPPIPYHLVDLEKYVVNTMLGTRTTHYFSSQGCPNGCAFCSELLVNKRKWSGLAPTRFLDDMERLVKNYAVNGVRLVEDNFFADQERVRGMCQGLVDRQLNIKWGEAYGVSRDLLRFDNALWNLMKESGCRSIFVGAESGSQEALELLGKGATVDETVRLAQICGQYGISILFSLMLGFPGVNIEREFHLMLDLIDRIMAQSPIHRFYLHIYTPYPGTPLSLLSTKYGFQPPKVFEGWSNFDQSTSNTPWVAKKYVRRVSMLTHYFFFFLGSEFVFHIDLIRNPFLRGIVRGVYNAFDSIVRWRWKQRSFIFPLDYWIFKYAILPVADRHLKSPGGKQNRS